MPRGSRVQLALSAEMQERGFELASPRLTQDSGGSLGLKVQSTRENLTRIGQGQEVGSLSLVFRPIEGLVEVPSFIQEKQEFEEPRWEPLQAQACLEVATWTHSKVECAWQAPLAKDVNLLGLKASPSCCLTPEVITSCFRKGERVLGPTEVWTVAGHATKALESCLYVDNVGDVAIEFSYTGGGKIIWNLLFGLLSILIRSP